MSSSRRRAGLVTCLALLLACAAIMTFRGALDNGFVFDDRVYITRNPQLQSGLTLSGVRWAFTSTYVGFWHPLTWLSHLTDVSLFGNSPVGPHAVALGLHILNAVLLFLVLLAMTGSLWRSCAVAALFALHPLRVPSVVWVSERKDLLSALFWILGTGAYLHYLRAPSLRRYGLLLATFLLGLLSKPMLISFPFALLLLDIWPLGRWSPWPAPGSPGSRSVGFREVVVEKVPLALLVAPCLFISILAQRNYGAIASPDDYPPVVRLANAALSYVLYLRDVFMPTRLSAFYLHPGRATPLLPAACAGVLLLALTIGMLRDRFRRPYLITGWFWFLGVLLPVSGLVPIGNEARADNWTYIPLIGVFLALIWLAADLVRKLALSRLPVLISMLVVLLLLARISARQTAVSKDDVTLFTRAVQVDPNNWVAHYNLGEALDRLGRTTEAVVHYRRTLALHRDHTAAHSNLAAILAGQGDLSGAAEHLRAALAAEPLDVALLYNLGVVLERQGRFSEAAHVYGQAAGLSPSEGRVQLGWGVSLLALGHAEEAIPHLRQAAALLPAEIEPHRALAQAFQALGNLEAAQSEAALVRRLEAVSTGSPGMPPGE